VDDDNTLGPWDGSQEYPFKRIQDGIDGASDGDTVLVLPGAYFEGNDFLGKAIRVKSSKGPLVTSIDHSAMGTVIDGTDLSTELLPVGDGPYAVTVNPVTNRIYVSNRNSATVTVIDGTGHSTQTVAVGNEPHGVAVNSVTNRIYVGNSGSHTVTVIDGEDHSTETVAVGLRPIAVAVNSVTNRIYALHDALPISDRGGWK